MERQPVTSSHIASIGYDEATRTLEIEFRRGAVYQYTDVPERYYLELMTARSIGRMFQLVIKDAGFRFKKIEQERVME